MGRGRRRTSFQIPNKKSTPPLSHACNAPLAWQCMQGSNTSQIAMTFAAWHHHIVLNIAAYIYTNKNLLYTAGASRMVCFRAPPRCLPRALLIYRSKEAYHFSEYMAKCCIRSAGCQHILICIYVCYLHAWYKYIIHKTHIRVSVWHTFMDKASVLVTASIQTCIEAQCQH